MKHPLGDRLVAPVRGLALVAAVGLLTAGCASTDSATTSVPPVASTDGATTSVLPVASQLPLTYSSPGTHAVGYREFEALGAQQQPLALRAWYPAKRPDGGAPTAITYTAPNKFGEQVVSVKQITAVGGAELNGEPEPSTTPYPLVVFSHGYGLSPIVYSTLVEHYASQGYVVLAPEHNDIFDETFSGFWQALIDRPVDIHRTIDHAEQLTKAGGPLAGLIDTDNVAVVGHSYGGYTALAAAGARFDFAAYKTRCAALPADDPLRFFCDPVVPKESDMAVRAGLQTTPTGLWPSVADPRIKSAISMAGDAYIFDQRGLAELTVPVMAMGGTVDDGTPYTWGARPTYDDASSKDKTLVTFPGAGHFVFVDPCDNLPWVQSFVYRESFCTDAVWGARPLDIVSHYTTAFLRSTLNGDAAAGAALAGKQPQLDDIEYETSLRP